MRKSRQGRRMGSKVQLAMTDVDPIMAVAKLVNDSVPGLFDDWKGSTSVIVSRTLDSVLLLCLLFLVVVDLIKPSLGGALWRHLVPLCFIPSSIHCLYDLESTYICLKIS